MPFEPVPGQFYRIIPKHSGKAIGAKDKLPHQGLPIVQVDRAAGDASQEFQVHREGNYYNFVARRNGQSMDVFAESQGDNVTVGQWGRYDYSLNQQFSFLPAGDGSYYISAHHSSKFLWVKDGSQDAGAPLVQHIWNGGAHFRFVFEPVAPIVDPRALREPVLRGADPLREAALGLIGLIPEVGGGPTFLIGKPWSDGPGLIDQMRDYVR